MEEQPTPARPSKKPKVPVVNEAGRKLEELAALALEYTATTEDPVVALKQAMQERQALVDFYAIVHEAEYLLEKLRREWAVVRRFLWGKWAITEKIQEVHKPQDFEKLAAAGRFLEKWDEKTEEVVETARLERDIWGQLSFLAALDRDIQEVKAKHMKPNTAEDNEQ